MKRASAVAAVVIAACLSGAARADGSLIEETIEWEKAHRGEVEACALSSQRTGHVEVWFTVEVKPAGNTVASEVLPEQRSLEPTPCWRRLVETFRPRSTKRAYAHLSCSIFRPGKNAAPTDKASASCSEWIDRADEVPERLVAWLVQTQLARALPSLAKCVELHGRHLPQLELVLERAYSEAMSVRYLREQPSSFHSDEERNSRPLGTCYAERIMAERARLVWPPSLPKREAPPLDVFFSASYPAPHAPVVYVRPPNKR